MIISIHLDVQQMQVDNSVQRPDEERLLELDNQKVVPVTTSYKENEGIELLHKLWNSLSEEERATHPLRASVTKFLCNANCPTRR